MVKITISILFLGIMVNYESKLNLGMTEQKEEAVRYGVLLTTGGNYLGRNFYWEMI